MKGVNLLEKKYRDRTSGYLIEIWYILDLRA